MVDIEAPGPQVPGGASREGSAADRAGPAGVGARNAFVVVATEVVLVTSGCVFAVIGVVDLGTSEMLVSKLFGGVLALIGCGLLAAAAGFRRRRPWAGVVGTVSLVPAFAFALYLSLNAQNEELAWSLVFGAITVGSAVSIVGLVRRCPPSFGVKSASILSVAGFALGFFQFSYAESARVRVGSTLTLSTDLVPASGGDGAITATVKTVNPTAAKIQSLGSLYVVEGVRLCGRSGGVREHAYFRDAFGDQTTVGSFSPRVAEQDVEMIQAGKIFEDRTYFEPGEEIVRRFAVAIPESEYDVVRLRVVTAVANGDRLRLHEVVRGPTPLRPRRDGMNGIAIQYRVSEGSLVDRIMHADRVVDVVWESGPDELHPELWASARLSSGKGAGADRSASYGIAFSRSTTELPLGGAELGATTATSRHRARDADPVLQMRAATFLAVAPPPSGPDSPEPAEAKPHKAKPHKAKPHKGKPHKGKPHKGKPHKGEPDEPDRGETEDSGESNEKRPGTTGPVEPDDGGKHERPIVGSTQPTPPRPSAAVVVVPGASAPQVRPAPATPPPAMGEKGDRSLRVALLAPPRGTGGCR